MIFAFRVNDMGTRVYLRLIFNNWFFAKLKIVREECMKYREAVVGHLKRSEG